MLSAATVVHGASADLAEEGEAGRQLDAQEARRGRLTWRLEIGWAQSCARSSRVAFLHLVLGNIVLVTSAWLLKDYTKTRARRS